MPSSSFSCKHAGADDHKVGKRRPLPVDGLFARALLPDLVESAGRVEGRRCPTCGEPLRGASGLWNVEAAARKRVVTRVARDVATGSYAPGQLFSTVQIDAGARFLGTVSRLDAEALGALRALEGAELRIGRGRRRGQGRVRVRIRAWEKLRFDQRLRTAGQKRSAYEALFGSLVGAPLGRAVAVLARTDLAIDPAKADVVVRDAIAPGVAGARVAASAQSTRLRAGWSDPAAGGAGGPRPLRAVVAAGSAWLVVMPRDASPDLGAIARAETDGIGELRELGLGRLLVDHEAFDE